MGKWEVYQVCWYWINGEYLEPINPDRMASRIFRMASGILRIGDVVSLVGKAVAEVSDADVSAMTENIYGATFDINNFKLLI